MRSAAVKAPIDGASSEGIRLRAMALGMVLCALIAVGLPYGEFVVIWLGPL